MSSINSIDIRLDLEDCSSLYDYKRGVRIEKPEKSWDTILPDLTRKHNEHVPISKGSPKCGTKCGAKWLDLMDRSWSDKKLLEKRICNTGTSQTNTLKVYDGELTDKGVMGFTDFNTSQDCLPSQVMAVYKPGDLIKGEVILDLAAPMTPDSLVINLLGSMVVQVRTYHEYGYHDHQEHEDYVDLTHIIWRKAGGKQKKQEFSSLTGPGFSTSPTLPAGISSFPFEFLLPTSVPGSLPPLIPSTANFAHLIYRLKATLIRGTFERNIVVNRCLWVEESFDIGSIPQCLFPVQEEKVMQTGMLCNTGTVTLQARIPSKAYLQSGHIPITVQVDNHSPDELTKVEARVVLQGKIKVGMCMSLKYKVNIQGAACESDYISPGMCPQFQWQLPLDFSPSDVDNNLMPVGTLDISKHLDVEYAVVVTAKRGLCKCNLKLEIPIVIGSENTGSKFGFDS